MNWMYDRWHHCHQFNHRGDFEFLMGAETGLITTPGDDDIDLQTLQNFALNIS
jgi:hypothetical protein